MAIRKPEMQIYHMTQANVPPGWNARRPEEHIELELEDKSKRSIRPPK